MREPGESSGSKSAAPASAPASAPAAAAAGTTADHGRIGGSASSDDGGGDDGLAGRSQTNRSSGAPELEGITPPRALLDPAGAGTGVTPRSSVGSGNRDSKFIENID
ncbi:hypothetical protein SLS64_007723 [Diaporthe eres]